jgi:flagellar biosynthesis protein FlhF
MQVKKFEARSMKEALDMVKTQLGPDAIILSAKDNSKSFGLGGNGSVEITAAVSEETLQKKRFVESRLREQERVKIQKAPAKVQKHFIDDMVQRYVSEKSAPHRRTSRQYIQIEDGLNEEEDSSSEGFQETSSSYSPAAGSPQNYSSTAARSGMSLAASAEERIKSAAQRAWNALALEAQASEKNRTEALGKKGTRDAQSTSQSVSVNTGAVGMDSVPDNEIRNLREELAQLKSTLSQFQKMPQNMIASNGAYPGSEYGLSYDFASVFEKLVAAGISAEIVGEILVKAQADMPPIRFKNKALIEGWVAKYILDTTKIVGELQGQRVQIFVGPAGSGKTSSLVKLASHYVVNGNKKVALLSCDTMKVGGSDQMKIYAQILNVPFAVIRSQQDWNYVLQQLSGYDYILCDAPGLGLKSIEEIQLLKSLIPPSSVNASVHLVLNCTSKDQDLTETGRRYKSVHFSDVIFTGLDDSVQQGGIYNFAHRFASPLHSFGIGPNVPEDFEIASRERVVDLIFKLSKVKKES